MQQKIARKFYSVKFRKMKTKELQNLVLLKHKNGKKAAAIFRELDGQISIKTVRRWIKMIVENGAIDLQTPPGRKRDARSTANVQRTKRLLKGKKKVTVRKLRDKLGISYGSAQSILTKDLRLRPYKKRVAPNLTDDQKQNRVRFYHWVKRNFKKSDSERILFSDEKWFTSNGVYNRQNDRIWAVNRGEADGNGGVHQKKKFAEGVMVSRAHAVGDHRKRNGQSKRLHGKNSSSGEEIRK